MYEFQLPDVGEGIHEAEILGWLVKPGDILALNQPMLEIQTDKAVVEIPAPVPGVVSEIRVAEGALARVGQVLVVIANPDEAHFQSAPSPEKPTTGIAGPGQRVLAAPAVRRLALALGVNLADVPGSGPAGRILPSDVGHFVKQQVGPEPTPGPAAGEAEPVHGLRRRMAQRMTLAWQIPHVTVFEEVEISRLAVVRQQLQPQAEQQGVKLTYLPFILKAVIQTLKEQSDFNAWFDPAGPAITRHSAVHLGIAAITPDGLLVPVMRHADQLNLRQLAAELARLTGLAEQRRLSQTDLSGSTFTVSNFGSLGLYQGTPIINPPEVAILGCGRIEEKPVVAGGQMVISPVLPLSLSFDHRWLDGAAAAAFLARLKALLANPNLLFWELV